VRFGWYNVCGWINKYKPSVVSLFAGVETGIAAVASAYAPREIHVKQIQYLFNEE